MIVEQEQVRRTSTTSAKEPGLVAAITAAALRVSRRSYRARTLAGTAASKLMVRSTS